MCAPPNLLTILRPLLTDGLVHWSPPILSSLYSLSSLSLLLESSIYPLSFPRLLLLLLFLLFGPGSISWPLGGFVDIIQRSLLFSGKTPPASGTCLNKAPSRRPDRSDRWKRSTDSRLVLTLLQSLPGGSGSSYQRSGQTLEHRRFTCRQGNSHHHACRYSIQRRHGHRS